MKINEIIRTRRHCQGLTQEALAQLLGVSSPAVNKWEKGLNYPDITLLPALARALGVDLNTLLSFQDDLTPEEIGHFSEQVTVVAQEQGCAAAFQLAREKMQEFPSCDLLTYTMAPLLEGILSLFPPKEEEAEPFRQEVLQLYQRAANSHDPQISQWACALLAGRYIAQNQLEEARPLLEQLPQSHKNKQLLQASLARKEGNIAAAWTLLEQELFTRGNGVLEVLSHLMDLAAEEKDLDRAEAFAAASQGTAEALHLPAASRLSLSFQLALLRQDGPQTLALLEEIFQSIHRPAPFSDSPLYCHLPEKDGAGKGQQMMLRMMVNGVEEDPACAFLRGLPQYALWMKKWQKSAFPKSNP